MDSHAFRIVGAELLSLLNGARVEKIHAPAEEFLVFSLFSKGRRWKLGVAFGRKCPSLFFYTTALPNPKTPPNIVMRLRKHLSGHKLGQGSMDYATRQLLIPLPLDGQYTHFLLSFGNPPELLTSIPEGFGSATQWPDQSIIEKLAEQVDMPAANLSTGKDTSLEKFGKIYPVLTPSLRETLRYLDLPEAMALMVDLEAGGENLFYYKGQRGKMYSAWPLPDALLENKHMQELSPADVNGLGNDHAFFHLAENFMRSSLVDEELFMSGLGAGIQHVALKPLRQENKKTLRLLKTLEQEEKRLTSMMELRREACLLQNALWQFAPDEKKADVYVEDGDGLCHIILDPRLTIRGNMQRMFHQSDRGVRGLAFLRERRARIEAEAKMQEEVLQTGGTMPLPTSTVRHKERISGRTGEYIAGNSVEIKEVQTFRSVDNYVILRGKSAKGNQKLLKLGQPHDLWLHSKDGPSAHAIIRLAHPADNVPESTMQEAARLVGEKSWQRDDAKAEIMVAMLCHVHSVKGGAPGAVRVDKVLRTLLVNMIKN